MTPIETFSLIFLATILLLVSEIEHKVVVALLAAVFSVYFGVSYGLYEIEDVYHMMDMETVLFIVASLILFESLNETGFFKFLSLLVFKKLRLKGLFVVYLLLAFATLFSGIAENTITMIIMTEITLSVFTPRRIDPRATVAMEGVMSNVGGLLLPISSIPGLIVATRKNIGAEEFLVIDTPLIFILLGVAILYYRLVLAKQEARIEELQVVVDDPWKAVENRSVLARSLLIFSLFIVGVLVSDKLGFTPSYVAFFFVTLMFMFSGENPGRILSKISWDVPFFVACFSIFVESLDRAGVLALVGSYLEPLISASAFLGPFVLLLISGVFSSVIANVSVVLLLLPIVDRISSISGLNPHPLYWSMIIGSNIGGGLTLYGSVPVLMAASLAEKGGHKISFGLYAKKIAPAVFLQLLVSDFYILLLEILGVL